MKVNWSAAREGLFEGVGIAFACYGAVRFCWDFLTYLGGIQ